MTVNVTEALARRYVSWRSETGTTGEAEFADRFVQSLREIPYFAANPDHIRLVASHGEPLTSSVVAVVRGTGGHALALAGHYDTVSIENYHDLAPLSCDPDALTTALIADLSSRRRAEQEERALVDLRSGEFLPGRGMLDMKSGLAAAVAVLQGFAEQAERRGNLVLLATPDEERESRGMRSLRSALPAVMSDFGLTLVGAINMDVTSDQGDGRMGRAIYEGTIGKLLPFALVIGGSAHASYPFDGISAPLIGAKIIARLEGRAALADADEREVSPPPICLEARDLREGYEVTTPERFWLAFNWLYHASSPADLFARFANEVRGAAAEAVAAANAEAARFGDAAGTEVQAVSVPSVITFAQLTDRARLESGDAAVAATVGAPGIDAIDNPLGASRAIVQALVALARLSEPTIIIGLAGLHYPSTALDLAQPDHAALRTAIATAKSEVEATGAGPIAWRPTFQGISDMSFLGGGSRGSDDTVVAENTPVPRLVDLPPRDVPSFPVVNIGPWGRDLHQRLERVHRGYAFDVLPRFVALIARRLLDRTTF